MIFAYTLIFGSFPVLFLTHDASGIWLFFIGMFLRSSAEASLQQTLLRHYLKGVYAGQMATLPSFIAPRTTLSEFDETYGRSKQKRFPVLHNAILVGVFEPRDMKKVPRQDWSSVLAEDLVRPTDEYVMISADTPAIEIPMRMVRAQASEVFVVKDGRFLGTITYHDLLSYVRTINSLKQS
jgi:CBS domain-containing protein